MARKEKITVFCGSSMGKFPAYAQAARALGEALGREGRVLVFGGCAMGLMKIVSQAAAAAGSRVISMRIQGMADPVDPDILWEDRLLANVQERKLALIQAGDACIALPGGIGTLDEIGDLYSMTQLGATQTPLGLLNTNGYYDPLLRFFDHMREEGFLSEKFNGMFFAEDTPEKLLRVLDEAAD